jgi:hypothetical protein
MGAGYTLQIALLKRFNVFAAAVFEPMRSSPGVVGFARARIFKRKYLSWWRPAAVPGEAFQYRSRTLDVGVGPLHVGG